MVCTGSACLRWPVCLEELVVDKTLNSTISSGLHHERRRHVEHLAIVASLTIGIVVVVAIVETVVLIPISGALIAKTTVVLIAILPTTKAILPIAALVLISILVMITILLIVISIGLAIAILVSKRKRVYVRKKST